MITLTKTEKYEQLIAVFLGMFVAGTFYLAYPTLFLGLINAVLMLGFAFYYRTLLLIVWAFAYSLLYVVPLFIVEFFGYHHPAHTMLNSAHYDVALFYIFCFNLVVVITYSFLSKKVHARPFFLVKYLPKINFKPRTAIGFLLMMVVCSHIAKWYLDYTNLFVMVSNNKVTTAITQLSKAISDLDFLCILIFGYLLERDFFRKKGYRVLYCCLIILTFWFSLKTGSRSKVCFLILVIAYNHKKWLSQNIKTSIAIFLIVASLSVYLFPMLAHYRGMHRRFKIGLLESAMEAKERYGKFDQTALDLLATRLNYISILAYVMNFYADQKESKFYYGYNLIGLIPRVFWKDKPKIIGINGNKIGRELKLVRWEDRKTGLGLGIYGASYYQIRWKGFLVGIFYALLLFFIDSRFRFRNATGHSLYCMLSLYLLSKDALFAVVPGMVYTIFPAIFFTMLFDGLKNEEGIPLEQID